MNVVASGSIRQLSIEEVKPGTVSVAISFDSGESINQCWEFPLIKNADGEPTYSLYSVIEDSLFKLTAEQVVVALHAMDIKQVAGPQLQPDLGIANEGFMDSIKKLFGITNINKITFEEIRKNGGLNKLLKETLENPKWWESHPLHGKSIKDKEIINVISPDETIVVSGDDLIQYCEYLKTYAETYFKNYKATVDVAKKLFNANKNKFNRAFESSDEFYAAVEDVTIQYPVPLVATNKVMSKYNRYGGNLLVTSDYDIRNSPYKSTCVEVTAPSEDQCKKLTALIEELTALDFTEAYFKYVYGGLEDDIQFTLEKFGNKYNWDEQDIFVDDAARYFTEFAIDAHCNPNDMSNFIAYRLPMAIAAYLYQSTTK